MLSRYRYANKVLHMVSISSFKLLLVRKLLQ